MEELANKIIASARNRLYFKHKALSHALYRLPVIYVDENVFGTDAYSFITNPMRVITMFKNNPDDFAHAYLHTVFHCIYLHPFLASNPAANDKDVWNIACDICVESAIARLSPEFSTPEKQSFLSHMTSEVKLAIPEAVYHWLVKEYPMSFHNIARMFYQDEHLWMYPSETDNHDTSDDSVAHDGSNSTNPSSSGKAQQNDTEEDWKEIARKVSVDMESFHQGSGTQNLTEEINYLTRDKVDYTDFLKSFATMEEIMKLNMDEFDLSYYIHGLNMNGKMLLIEPLEYKDDYRIKEFVIAIDTSGSCSGEVIQAFIRKTYNILKTTESFSQRVNIHIIQCDDTIKQDVKITSSEELEAYISSMKLIGFGGTDFRPVFHYVDELENKNEFANLSGLIYFTDGMGTYPVNPTHYKTAFVFLENFQYADKEVPPWVLKAYWKEGGSTET